jgi:rod shape determining protein RodA
VSKRYDPVIIIPALFLLGLSYIILRSVAPSLFPGYFWYFILAGVLFLVFSLLDFEVLAVFSKYFYWIAIILLLITIVIGQVTRGTVRWIPIGSLSFQPSEIVRPLFLIYFANFLTEKRLDIKRLFKALVLMAIPLFLILIQPSLGVTILTAVGFFGLFLASELNKKHILFIVLAVVALMPLVYLLLQPYQKLRVETFLNPEKDPLGAGYNSIQSMISVGSGEITGRGLGKGVQTQLSFLPERHTDFIFASVSEEMGFVGAGLMIVVTAVLFWRIVSYTEKSVNPAARAFLSGLFLTLFAQVVVHVGMNMGLLPVTGVPYPLVSAGGSSLLATMTGLGIVLGTKRS